MGEVHTCMNFPTVMPFPMIVYVQKPRLVKALVISIAAVKNMRPQFKQPKKIFGSTAMKQRRADFFVVGAAEKTHLWVKIIFYF